MEKASCVSTVSGVTGRGADQPDLRQQPPLCVCVWVILPILSLLVPRHRLLLFAALAWDKNKCVCTESSECTGGRLPPYLKSGFTTSRIVAFVGEKKKR